MAAVSGTGGTSTRREQVIAGRGSGDLKVRWRQSALIAQGHHCDDDRLGQLAARLHRDIEVLEVIQSTVGEQGAAAVAEGLQSSTDLRAVHLSKCRGIHGSMLAVMLLGLARSDRSTLDALSFEEDGLDAEDARLLASALRGEGWTSRGEALFDTGEPSGSASEASLPVALPQRQPPPLTVLRLAHNRVADRGCRAIAQALLGDGSTLKELFLDDNRIGDPGVQALASALEDDRTLAVLSLGFNRIGPRGASALAEALVDNPCVVDVALPSNHMGTRGAVKFAELLDEHTNLSVLDLRDNSLGSLGYRILSRAIEGHPALAVLKLQGNAIGDCTCKACLCSRKTEAPVQFTLELDSDGMSDLLADMGLDKDGRLPDADGVKAPAVESDSDSPESDIETPRKSSALVRQPAPRRRAAQRQRPSRVLRG